MKTIAHRERMIGRIRAIWSELAYAQRRMFEIRTGVALDERRPAVRWPHFRD